MWLMAWALCLVGKAQYAAGALVMGGAGLRIGECCERRRRDYVDGPKGAMWISFRGTLATLGRTWTDSGDSIERRGTKAKGPDGDMRGRRTGGRATVRCRRTCGRAMSVYSPTGNRVTFSVGLVVITRDIRIRSRPAEAEQLAAAGICGFVLTSAGDKSTGGRARSWCVNGTRPSGISRITRGAMARRHHKHGARPLRVRGGLSPVP